MIPYLQISALIISYLLGSVPFGFLLTKLAGYGDIRRIGSGNIGATNVLRTGDKKLAVLTLLLDGGKGVAAVLVVQSIFPDIAPMAGLAVLVGHLLPIWLDFKGGKGVATGVGVLLALAWPVGLAAIATWLLIAYTSRYSSLAALVAFGLAPAFTLFFGHGDWIWLPVCMLMLIIWKHTENIIRLKQGKEPKIGEQKNASNT
jgi:acyl phosphate:glycerol-3-phosphate acyltransferase